MEKANAGSLLKQLILEKEAERQVAGKLLKEHLHVTYESLKPANILKSAFIEMIDTSDFKTNMVNKAIGFVAGSAARIIFKGRSHNPLTKVASIILEMIVADKVSKKISKNADEIKLMAGLIMRKIVNLRRSSEKAQ